MPLKRIPLKRVQLNQEAFNVASEDLIPGYNNTAGEVVKDGNLSTHLLVDNLKFIIVQTMKNKFNTCQRIKNRLFLV